MLSKDGKSHIIQLAFVEKFLIFLKNLILLQGIWIFRLLRKLKDKN